MYVFNLFLPVLLFTCAIYSVVGDECVYDGNGICIEGCPPDTYSYTPSCMEETMSQRTCRAPVARSLGQICDYSRCDCREPKVWDEAEKKCVLIADCSEQQIIDENDIKV
ncbi:uncharacterized protein LOC106134679 [Amyelois transitella]|uniref:uncharacterized protein LOC106134679 n=1 Tax=Amyelois transitella TaxID=680683 RepID=UPI0029903019|nr:uncharacterized protein LOC106134679 [Amyelois transitella]